MSTNRGAEREKYLAIIRELFGAEQQAYYRGYLCCFGTTVTDIGRGETWRDAALSVIESDIRERLLTQVRADAEKKLAELEALQS